MRLKLESFNNSVCLLGVQVSPVSVHVWGRHASNVLQNQTSLSSSSPPAPSIMLISVVPLPTQSAVHKLFTTSESHVGHSATFAQCS